MTSCDIQGLVLVQGSQHCPSAWPMSQDKRPPRPCPSSLFHQAEVFVEIVQLCYSTRCFKQTGLPDFIPGDWMCRRCLAALVCKTKKSRKHEQPSVSKYRGSCLQKMFYLQYSENAHEHKCMHFSLQLKNARCPSRAAQARGRAELPWSCRPWAQAA